MKRRTAYLALAILALAFAGCVPPPTEPGGIVITNTNTNTNNGGIQPGGASPSPGAAVIHHVGIGVFGEGNCDPGKTIAGSERDNDVRVGCVANITCSGFTENGDEIFDTGVTGARPEVFRLISGEGAVRATEDSNPYNMLVRAVAPGPAVFECVLKGVSSNAGRNGPFRMTAVP